MATRSLLVLSMILLTACDGQNPFKRTSNPTSEYKSLIDNSIPDVPGAKGTPAPAPDNSQKYCGNALSITVMEDKGANVMTFVEGVARTYKIETVSDFPDYSIITDAEDVGIARLSPAGGVTAQYALTWKPKMGIALGSIRVVNLKLVQPLAQQLCGNLIKVPVNLIVQATVDEPTVSFSFAKPSLTFGEKANFQITVNDPASTDDIGPSISEIGFDKSAKNSERPLLDGSSAVNCEDPKRDESAETLWTFNCEFDSVKLAKADKERFQDTGDAIDSAVYVTAKSGRGAKKVSVSTPGIIKVIFPKKEEVAKEDIKPAAPSGAKVAETAKPASPKKPTAAKPAAKRGA